MKIEFSSSFWPVLAFLVGVAQISLLGQQTDEARPLTRLENNLADGVYRPVELGPHHRVMERVIEVQDQAGFLQPQRTSYVELATGMHVWSQAEQKWVEASDEIEILPEGAVARKSQHQVSFAADLNDPDGTIELLTPDGTRLVSRCVGLAFTEVNTGRSAWIAEVKDSPGLVLGRNQVFYLNAFDSIQADVRYASTRSSFEADVILREKLPSPAEYGLNPETTKLEVWTEFLNAPEPRQKPMVPQNRNGQEETDVTLEFGVMQIGPGKAFSVEAEEAADPLERDRNAIAVSKEWTVIEGKSFLIETVPYAEAKPQIDTLPDAAVKVRIDPQKKNQLMARSAEPRRTRPVSFALGTRSPTQPRTRQIAKAASLPAQRGFVLDWVSVSSSTNFTFKGGTTYFITNQVNLSGTTRLEGAVLKFAPYTPGSNEVQVSVTGPFECLTSSYRPAVFTAKDDDTIGERIAGSTGSPTNWTYAYYSLKLINGLSNRVENVRMRWAVVGCLFSQNAAGSTVQNAQFYKCFAPIFASVSSINVRNVLAEQSDTVIYAEDSIVNAEHVTANGALFLPYTSAGKTSTNTIYNSLFAGVTYLGTVKPILGSHNATNSSSAGLFQTVGAGNHYLAAGSTNRNAGTTSLSTEMLALLKQRTTYPPTIVSNHFVIDTTLSPQAQRDTDVPDRGYHYDPLDYALRFVEIRNCTLKLAAGVALCTYGPYGLQPATGGKLISEGTPTMRNKIARFVSVQEGTNDWGGSATYDWTYSIIPITSDLTGRTAEFSYTDFHALNTYTNIHGHCYFHSASGYELASLKVRDCQLYDADATLGGPSNAILGIQNNLFERCRAFYYMYPTLSIYNNHHRGGVAQFYRPGTNVWTVQDNVFDDVTVQDVTGGLTHGYNGYIGSVTRLQPTQSTDKVLSSLAYESGALGRYYQPGTSALLNAGSRSAAAAGLYHHTTQTNQTKESTSTVDIGLHYVALDSSGQPVDSDGDALPDYAEDRDGDGTADSGETNWLDPFKVLITEPKSNSNVP